ncbi:MAG: Arc family DNA-binding protein [Peptococcaceae bacterium]|jgi:plasmid stability protein|nr:Arc family DNA-binding protein [Peptococcaceae bacterium]
MPDMLIRGVPQHILENLKKRAKKNRRSLQSEALLIMEEAARYETATGAQLAAGIRQKLAGSGTEFSDSAEIIRGGRKA